MMFELTQVSLRGLRLAVLCILAAVFLAGCASRPAPATAPALVAQAFPVDNFGTVSQGTLYRGARPDAASIHQLCTSAYRIKTIVNLEMEDDDIDAIRRDNVRYFHFPIVSTPFFWLFGGDLQIRQFLEVVTKAEFQPVYVHCRHGADRTGEAVAAYRILVQGWGYEKAAAELALYHHFELLYPQVKSYLRALHISTNAPMLAKS